MTDVMTDAELVERWPGYNTQSWAERFKVLDNDRQQFANQVTDMLVEQSDRIQSLTADLERAKAALRPFAAIGEMANFAFAPALFQDADTIKKLPWRDGEEEVTITFGNVRHAASTLKDISHD